MAQPVDAVALHQPHRPGIVIGPHRLGAVALGSAGQLFRDLVERLLPRERLEGRLSQTFLPHSPQRSREPLRMMLALGLARDLGPDAAAGVGLRRGASHPPYPSAVYPLDLERAGARAIVGTDAVNYVERQGSAPPGVTRQTIPQNAGCRVEMRQHSRLSRRRS